MGLQNIEKKMKMLRPWFQIYKVHHKMKFCQKYFQLKKPKKLSKVVCVIQAHGSMEAKHFLENVSLLRIFIGKKHPQIKLQHLQKV